LADYIANQTAAIQLGKALFWDMQAGSDNKTACATCHSQAGADVRTRNQLNPGPDTTFNVGGVSAGPNFQLMSASFPISPTHDDIAGSQGVRQSTFQSIGATGEELTTTPTGFRQVTGMNTPSAINAVFNHRNFWNGRAQPEFNGVNPWGSRNLSARVWVANSLGNLSTLPIRIQNASLASQAVGPVLNDVEMSALGRTFPDVGQKMLRLKPLRLQKVDARDSVLGKLADTKTKGLKTTYTSLIQQAFQPKWWNSTQTVAISSKTYSLMEANFSLFWGLAIMLYEATLVSDNSPMDQFLAGRTLDPLTGLLVKEGNPTKLNQVASRLATDHGYTGGVNGILNGLKLFEQPLPPFGAGRECIACHLGANTTGASVERLVEGGLEPGDAAFKAAGFDLRMERMFMQVPPLPTDLLGIIQTGSPTFFTDWITFDPGTYAITATGFQGTPTPPFNVLGPGNLAPAATYDAGWYNVGVRPPEDNPGVGGTDPFGSSLSWVEFYQQTLSDPGIIKVPGGAPGCLGAGNTTFPDEVLNASGFPLLSGPLRRTEPTDALASFKTSALRNVELNGPYFHNGGKSTLRQVVEFYDDGGDFPAVGDPERGAAFPTDRRSPLVKFYGDLSANGLGMTSDEVNDLVAFMLALTDDRVRYQRAPFDHPELVIPNGQEPSGTDVPITLPAGGAAGSTTPLRPFLTPLTPFQ
jgi:cytochrome c peroxidase